MTITIDEIKGHEGKPLPGGELVIEPHENAILEHAVRATETDPDFAHPSWFVVISLRCMGISVDKLCELAGKSAHDTLLFGNCEIDQRTPLRVGVRYRTEAMVSAAGSRTTRDGSRLDNLGVQVRIVAESGAVTGTVTSTYLFKRGTAK